MADLISLTDYKLMEGLSSPKDDYKISQLINSVSQLVKTYCGNGIIDFYSTPKVEEFSIKWNTDFVQLTESPLNSVTSVQTRENETSAYQTLTSSQYYVDYSTDSVHSIGKNWPRGFGAVKITYTAGYSETPQDLRLAVIDLIRYYMKNEYKDRQTLAGATIENPAAGANSSVAFPDHIKRVLDLYKNF